MEAVILIFRRQETIDDTFKEAFEKYKFMKSIVDGRNYFTIYTGNVNDSNIYVSECDAEHDGIDNEFSSNELSFIQSIVDHPKYYVLNHRGIDAIKEIISLTADRIDCVVDNTFGTILRGNDFVKLLKERPDWNWKED